MPLDSLSRHIYELRFENKFLKLTGNAFEDFFSEVMEKKYGGDFMRCRPWGKRGDRKNDGYLKSKRMLFQVYAPNEMTEKDFKKKVEADFKGAKQHWKKYFDKWIFVHNSKHGLGPEQLKLLFELDESHANICVVHWGFEDIRSKVFDLDKENLASLLGPVDLFETIQNEEGRTIQEATNEGFEAELDQVAEETKEDLKRRAEDNYDAGKSYVHDHCYKDAAASYKKSVDALPTMSAFLNLGGCYYYISNYANAESAFRAGLDIAAIRESREFESAFLSNIGLIHSEQGRLAEALESYQASLKIECRLGNPLGQAQGLSNTGTIYFQEGRLDEAIEAYRKAQQIFEEIGDLLGQARTLGNIGLVHRNHGKSQNALGAFQSAMIFFAQIGDPYGLAKTFVNIGTIYSEQGKLDEGLAAYQNGQKIFEQVGNQLGHANALGGIGNILYEQERLDDALESYQEALEIFIEIGNRLGQADTLGNIGNVYLLQGKLDEALKAYQDALKLHKQIGYPLGQANQLANIGLLCRQQGDGKAALEHYRQARDIYTEHGFGTPGLQIVEKSIHDLEQNGQ